LRAQSTLGERFVAWLWTDNLAALLVEQDGVVPGDLLDWLSHPMAYRVSDGRDPLAAARELRAVETGTVETLAAVS
jgi:hypothetical protein